MPRILNNSFMSAFEICNTIAFKHDNSTKFNVVLYVKTSFDCINEEALTFALKMARFDSSRVKIKSTNEITNKES